MHKQASRMKLRFQTSKGLLSSEELWDLSIADLDTLAVSLEKEYEKSDGKSFVRRKTEKDRTAKLRFDIVLDILQTKMEDNDAARNAADDKEHNEKILGMIAKKKEDSLSSMSVAELEALLRK